MIADPDVHNEDVSKRYTHDTIRELSFYTGEKHIDLGFVGSCMVHKGDIKIVAGMSSLGALLVFVAVNIALIVLRFKAPDKERPFKVPLSIGKVPILPILAIVISLSLVIQYDWQVYAAFVGAIVVGVILDYFLDKRPKEDIDAEKEKELFTH